MAERDGGWAGAAELALGHARAAAGPDAVVVPVRPAAGAPPHNGRAHSGPHRATFGRPRSTFQAAPFHLPPSSPKVPPHLTLLFCRPARRHGRRAGGAGWAAARAQCRPVDLHELEIMVVHEKALGVCGFD